tara:strand:+ start:350 stop:577 length:228 start_codon:yes stop_codon:yes gene_type:complete
VIALLRIPGGIVTSKGLFLVWALFEGLGAYRLIISCAIRPNGNACKGWFVAENQIVKVRQKIVIKRRDNIAQSSL